jgi:diguanylate cyclase (GGDEF)-like protein
MTRGAERRKIALAQQVVAQINAQADAARAQLFDLQEALARLQEEPGLALLNVLLEANEQLVLAAMHAEGLAEAAATDLGELSHQAQRDALTGVPNRTLLMDRLEGAIALARRRNALLAVLFLDIDHFKPINDRLGHAVGDGVLTLVARRLESVVRESDTVSRYGGDEFVLLLPELGQSDDAALIAGKLLTALAEPADVGGQFLNVSASVGIALWPDDAANGPALISLADAAMYRAKRSGGARFVFHRQADTAESQAHAPSLQPPQPSHLVDVNEQLVISALAAQDALVRSSEAQQRQVQRLAVVAHELRNPLTPIHNAAELMLGARTNEAALIQLQGVITRQVTHLARLVDDLLDGSRAGTGKFRLDPAAVEMVALLAGVADSFRPSLVAREQKLQLALPAAPVEVEGDALRLAQVIGNLLDNASKYTPSGGEILLSLAVLGETAVVTVLDNGAGISSQTLPHVFDLFTQADDLAPLRRGGMGIGLAVVRELVQAHGGNVEAHSDGLGRGSRFAVTLPLRTDAAAEANAMAAVATVQ